MGKKYYALYKGDQILCVGNEYELAKYLGVKQSTIKYMSMPVYHKRVEGWENATIVYKIEEEEEDENGS